MKVDQNLTVSEWQPSLQFIKSKRRNWMSTAAAQKEGPRKRKDVPPLHQQPQHHYHQKRRSPRFFQRKNQRKARTSLSPSSQRMVARQRCCECKFVFLTCESGGQASWPSSMRVSGRETFACFQLSWLWKGGLQSGGLWSVPFLCHPGLHQGGAGCLGQEK